MQKYNKFSGLGETFHLACQVFEMKSHIVLRANEGLNFQEIIATTTELQKHC